MLAKAGTLTGGYFAVISIEISRMYMLTPISINTIAQRSLDDED